MRLTMILMLVSLLSWGCGPESEERPRPAAPRQQEATPEFNQDDIPVSACTGVSADECVHALYEKRAEKIIEADLAPVPPHPIAAPSAALSDRSLAGGYRFPFQADGRLRLRLAVRSKGPISTGRLQIVPGCGADRASYLQYAAIETMTVNFKFRYKNELMENKTFATLAHDFVMYEFTEGIAVVEPVRLEEIELTIHSVYPGSREPDTVCIAEVRVF